MQQLKLKIFISIFLLTSGKLYPEVYTIVGVIGVYCAFQLIKGLKTGCWVRLVCWISFQCAAIFNLIYVYVNLSDVIESISGPNMQKLISVAIFMHIIIEIYCLITIMEICARIGDEMTQEVNNFDSDPPPYKLLNEDHPPLYEEVMQLNV